MLWQCFLYYHSIYSATSVVQTIDLLFKVKQQVICKKSKKATGKSIWHFLCHSLYLPPYWAPKARKEFCQLFMAICLSTGSLKQKKNTIIFSSKKYRNRSADLLSQSNFPNSFLCQANKQNSKQQLNLHDLESLRSALQLYQCLQGVHFGTLNIWIELLNNQW